MNLMTAVLLILAPVGVNGLDENEEAAKWIERLGDDDPAVRELATEALIAMGPEILPLVEKACGSDDPEVKSRAGHVLRTIEITKKVQFSEKMLKWFPEIYRELANNPTARGRFDIFARLTVFDMNKKRRAVEVENTDIAEVVKLLAEDGFRELTREEKQEIADICGGLYPWEHRRIDSSDGPIKDAGTYLLSLLRDEDASVRNRTVEALWRMHAKEHAKDIVSLLNDADPSVRAETARALGRLKAKEFGKNLVPLLMDSSTPVRLNSIDALGELKATEHARDLLPLLNDEDGMVRGWTASVLGRMGAKDYFKEILPLLKDKYADVRGRAALALLELGRKNDVPKEQFIKDFYQHLEWWISDPIIAQRLGPALKDLNIDPDEIHKVIKQGTEESRGTKDGK